MNKTRLILIGGFLGAGKTTMLWETARKLMKKGKRTGLITNDQAPGLVDTAFLLQKKIKVAEVSGSCFCCNYNGLTDALKRVKAEMGADVIVAEPVGSCTDLSATILQPLKANMNHDLVIGPLTVLADPFKISDIMDGGTADLHPSVAYIYRKQLEEADIILISKSDLLRDRDLERLKERVKRSFPGPDVLSASALTGEGINNWLNEVLQRNEGGKRIADINYAIYAEGEAVLGWLNATLTLTALEKTDWDGFAQNLLKELGSGFDRENAAIGHVKLIAETPNGYTIGNLPGNKDKIRFQGKAGKSTFTKLILNARVEMPPEKLENMTKEKIKAFTSSGVEVKIMAWNCLSPGKPEPTWRYNHIVRLYN